MIYLTKIKELQLKNENLASLVTEKEREIGVIVLSVAKEKKFSFGDEKVDSVLKDCLNLSKKIESLKTDLTAIEEIQNNIAEKENEKNEIKENIKKLEKEKEPNFVLFGEYVMDRFTEFIKDGDKEALDIYNKIIDSYKKIEILNGETTKDKSLFTKIKNTIKIAKISSLEYSLPKNQSMLGKLVFEKLYKSNEINSKNLLEKHFIKALFEDYQNLEHLNKKIAELDSQKNELKNKEQVMVSGKPASAFISVNKNNIEKLNSKIKIYFELLGKEARSRGVIKNFGQKAINLDKLAKDIEKNIDNYNIFVSRLEAAIKMKEIEDEILKKQSLLSKNLEFIENKEHENEGLREEIKKREEDLDYWAIKKGEEIDFQNI